MAECIPCSRNAGIATYTTQSVSQNAPFVVANCEVTLESLQELNDKLHCFLEKGLFVNCTRQEVHVIKGMVLSMINLEQYCKYDLSSFIDKTKNVECTTNYP